MSSRVCHLTGYWWQTFREQWKTTASGWRTTPGVKTQGTAAAAHWPILCYVRCYWVLVRTSSKGRWSTAHIKAGHALLGLSYQPFPFPNNHFSGQEQTPEEPVQQHLGDWNHHSFALALHISPWTQRALCERPCCPSPPLDVHQVKPGNTKPAETQISVRRDRVINHLSQTTLECPMQIAPPPLCSKAGHTVRQW